MIDILLILWCINIFYDNFVLQYEPRNNGFSLVTLIAKKNGCSAVNNDGISLAICCIPTSNNTKEILNKKTHKTWINYLNKTFKKMKLKTNKKLRLRLVLFFLATQSKSVFLSSRAFNYLFFFGKKHTVKKNFTFL